MNYYKIRGRPEDPKNQAIVKHRKSLEELISVHSVSKLERKPSRTSCRTEYRTHQKSPKKTYRQGDNPIVQKLGHAKPETIHDRIQTEIYNKIVPKEKASKETQNSREAKTRKLIEEVLNDNFTATLDIEATDENVLKTIEETQKEINLATKQLMEINKLLDDKKSDPCFKTVKAKSKQIHPYMSLRNIMRYNQRRGWEWMQSQYFQNVDPLDNKFQ